MIKFKYVDLLTGTSHNGAGAVSGEARGRIGLGANYGIVRALEVKGDDADVDTNASLLITDAEGRRVVSGITTDAGGTTSDEFTAQTNVIGSTVSTASTVGYFAPVGYPEALYMDANGLANDDTGGEVPVGVFAKSPLTVTLTAGTDGDWHRVGVWVEV